MWFLAVRDQVNVLPDAYRSSCCQFTVIYTLLFVKYKCNVAKAFVPESIDLKDSHIVKTDLEAW